MRVKVSLPRATKNFIQRWMRRLGYSVVPLSSPTSHEGHLKRLLQELDIDCVIDVGAHAGEFGALLRSIGYRGEIISFEPSATIFPTLREQCKKDALWRAYPEALGAESAQAQLRVFESSFFSSFLVPSEYGEREFSGEITGSAPVSVRTLDSLLSEELSNISQDRRIFLKIDTQGWDMEVLEGSQATLTQVRALQVEASVRPIYEGAPGWKETIARLDREGYKLSGLFPVVVDKDLRLVEFDCIAVRAK